jgi:hypothetical protein
VLSHEAAFAVIEKFPRVLVVPAATAQPLAKLVAVGRTLSVLLAAQAA